MEYPANRVSQLDSNLLDSTLVEHFGSEIDKVLEPFSRGGNVSTCTMIKEVLTSTYSISQCYKGKTPGHSLLNIGNFSSEKRTLIWNYILGTVARRVLEIIALLAQRQNVLKATGRLLALLSLIDFVHHFYFLNRGGPSKFVERMLNLKTTYATRPTLGTLNFDGLNREMIGHSFGHFCVLFTPMLQYVKYVLNTRKSKPSRNNETQSTGSLLMCDKCTKVAIFPTTTLAPTNEDNYIVLCYYCRMLDGNSKISFCGNA